MGSSGMVLLWSSSCEGWIAVAGGWEPRRESTGLGSGASEARLRCWAANMGEPMVADSGLVGRDDSMVEWPIVSKIEELLYMDRGELGTDEGAIEDCVCKDCMDRRCASTAREGGMVIDVLDRIAAADEGGVALMGVQGMRASESGVSSPSTELRFRLDFGRRFPFDFSRTIGRGFSTG